jgi:hypothetical protein
MTPRGLRHYSRSFGLLRASKPVVQGSQITGFDVSTTRFLWQRRVNWASTLPLYMQD